MTTLELVQMLRLMSSSASRWSAFQKVIDGIIAAWPFSGAGGHQCVQEVIFA
jgi:hypothetical protein